MQLIQLELKALLKHPAFYVLALAVVAAGYLLMGSYDWIYLGSLGGLGRYWIVIVTMLAPPLMGLAALVLIFPEFRHGESLWGTGLPPWKRLPAKFLAAVGGTTLALILGGTAAAIAAFWHRLPWDAFTLAGWEYLLGYFVYITVIVAFWVAWGFLGAYLTRSRIGTIALPVIIWVLLFSGTILESLKVAFAREGERGLLLLSPIRVVGEGNFSPFAPWGILPVLGLTGLGLLGIVLVLLGGALWGLARWPAWRGMLRPAILAFLLIGLVISSGGYAGGWQAARGVIAPFTLKELLLGQAALERPYLFDREGRRLAVLGPFIAFFSSREASLPPWTQPYVQAGWQVFRGDILTLIYPPGRTYPEELEGGVRRVRQMLKEAFWLKDLKIVVWPGELTTFSPMDPGSPAGFHALATSEALLISSQVVTDGFLSARDSSYRWDVAKALAEGAGLNSAGTAYLTLYLMRHGPNFEQALQLIKESSEIGSAYWRFYRYIAPDEEATPEEIARLRKGLEAEYERELKRYGTGLFSPKPILPKVPSNPREVRLELERLRLRENEMRWLRMGIGITISTEEYLQFLSRLRGTIGQGLAEMLEDPYIAWLTLKYWNRGEEMGHEAFIRSLSLWPER